jgi:hypothetical protein
MAEDVTYYAIMRIGRNAPDPVGLARRRVLDSGGILDEAIQRDLSWVRSSAIVEWERDDLTFELVEVDQDRADEIVAYFRDRWRD